MKYKTINPTRSQFNILRQICNYIPVHEVSKIARETGAEEKSRTFKPWSHVVSLLYAQLTHSIGLNDLCDSLQLHSGPLSTLRGATAPSRNGLSNANRERPAEMAEKLFWGMVEYLGEQSPRFVAGKRRGLAFRFKMPIHVVDTTVLELVANCMDWAKHRRRKAAAKTCCLTRATWTTGICGIWMCVVPFGSPGPKTTWLMMWSKKCPGPRMRRYSRMKS